MKNLSEEKIRWLINISNGDIPSGSIVHIQDDFALAADSYRLHGIGLDNIPDQIDGLKIKKTLDDYAKHEAIEKVRLNPDFLRDAIEGFKYETSILLSISRVDGDHISVKLSSEDGHAVAIIACIHMEDDNGESS